MRLSADLSWSDHKKALTKTLRQRIAIIRRLKYKISDEGLKVIAEGIFNSLIRYGIPLYCKPKLTNEDRSNAGLDELQVLHNEMQRTILGYRVRDKVQRKKIWEETGMMTVNQMACYHLMMETNNVLNFGSSESLRECMREGGELTNVKTRANMRGDLKVPNNVEKLNGFAYYGAKLWNRLPKELREAKTNGRFRSGVKKWIRENIPQH
jgi:hypothetical protein